MRLRLFFDIEDHFHLGIAIKGDMAHGANLHAGQPDIIAGLQTLHVVKDDMEVEHPYKSLMLTPDGENGNQQDGQSDRDKDAYSQSFTGVYFAHESDIKLYV